MNNWEIHFNAKIFGIFKKKNTKNHPIEIPVKNLYKK